jgi:hypothetical protein
MCVRMSEVTVVLFKPDREIRPAPQYRDLMRVLEWIGPGVDCWSGLVLGKRARSCCRVRIPEDLPPGFPQLPPDAH